MNPPFRNEKLGAVARFVRGVTFKPTDVVELIPNENVACMRTANVQSDLDVSDLWAIDKAFVKRNDQYLKEGDLLISSANSAHLVGKCCWIPPLPWHATFGGFVTVLRADETRLHNRFLYWWFASAETQALVRSFGRQTTNIANLNIERCESTHIPLPPVAEQRRIAAILDQADALRRKRREALEKLDTLAAALLARSLNENRTINSASTVTLDSVVRMDDKINYGVVQPGPEVENGIPMIRVENVVGNDFRPHLLKKIGPKIEAQYQRSRLKGDEILVACVGSIGAVALATSDTKGFNIARAVARVPIDSTKAERVFVAELLRAAETQAYFKNETRAVAQPTLNIAQLCSTPITLPPLEAQRAFAARVAEIDKLKDAHRTHLEKLDALFTTLQHRAFRGELVTRAVQHETALA